MIGLGPPPPGQEAELRQSLRDVLGLMALPAVWRNKSVPEIFETFSQALEAVVDADILFAMAAADSPVIVCRSRGRSDTALAIQAREWFGSCLGATSQLRSVHCGPFGDLNVVCEPLAYGGALGHVVVASRTPGFPTPRELTVIKAASSVLTNALEIASALKEREAALQAKDEFLALLGHELRNPLAPIVTALDVLRQREQGLEAQELQVMRRQVEHLRRLVDDLLDVSKVGRNALALHPEPVRVADIVADALEATAPLFDEREHQLSVSLPEQDVFVHGDAVRLGQALGNLLVNAAKYTPKRGQVWISAQATGTTLTLSVRDDGTGIDPSLMPTIFDKFVQGKRDPDRKHGGLGLGLSLVRMLVEMHGGSVSAHSAGAGKGAEFIVSLPISSQRAPSPRTAPAPAPPQPAQADSGRVLIVDDNADAAEMLTAALASVGYTVRMETDPIAALAALDEFMPDIGILDIGMPRMDGYELCAAIRQRFSADVLPLIAVTGYGRESDKSRAVTAGFSAHSAKPVQLKALVDQMRALLAPGKG